MHHSAGYATILLLGNDSTHGSEMSVFDFPGKEATTVDIARKELQCCCGQRNTKQAGLGLSHILLPSNLRWLCYFENVLFVDMDLHVIWLLLFVKVMQRQKDPSRI